MKNPNPAPAQNDILVVDDTVPNLRLLSGMLKEHGFKVRCVSSGAMALMAVHSAPPGLILLDITMPEMNGYEVCQRLKGSPQTRDIPVIFISALDEVHDQVRAFEAGGVDYITKPFQLQEVLARVQSHLNLRHLQEELQHANEELEARVQQRTEKLAETVALLKDQIAERERAQKEKAALQEELHQSQKMEALGRLAGGVAHDFNNLLSVVLGNVDVILESPAWDEFCRKRLELIRDTGMQAASLTQQLLAFSKRQVIQPKIVDLNAAIRDVEQMIKSLAGKRIKLTTRLDPHLGSVKVDPSQLSQVILNLAVNARDAMPEGGELTLETANVSVPESTAPDPAGLPMGAYVALALTDTGVGMDEETQKRVFEPFFTTKPKDRGTGLGLSTVHGIVCQSGGHIRLRSAPNQGTQFHVFFPRVS